MRQIEAWRNEDDHDALYDENGFPLTDDEYADAIIVGRISEGNYYDDEDEAA